ncbi:MAG: PfkB family carbohydrate kinase [Candidatus Dojkabacteria bacterium]|nr:PfkB family carbohydrate kinase [Candidatus Dojkabacteria bacterium]
MKPQILVVVSIAYDIIFAIHGDIRNEIPLKNGAIDKVNLMFTAKNKNQYFGGTAGNISYGIGQLGSSSILFSVAGEDFERDYKPHLEKNLTELKLVIKEKEHTATYYGISDEKYQQIGIWQPNAYGDWIEEVCLTDTIDEKDLNSVKVAIFSPGTGISTRNHITELRKINSQATIIFDPSQVLSIFYDKPLLTECLSHSDIVIGNDTEIAQFKTMFDLGTKDLLKIGLRCVIETKGGDGCIIHSSKGSTKIDPVKPAKILETTGAGDAFRSGLIFGLSRQYSIEKSCKLGAYMGARSVEEYSGQMYTANKSMLKTLKLI